LPANLTRQGAAMWRALIADFVAAGCTVTTMRDRRLAPASGVAEEVRVGPGDEPAAIFEGLAKEAEAGLVIAPESDRLLAGWVGQLERVGVHHLGSSPEAVSWCADKLALAERLTARGVATPATHATPAGLTGPAVAKPRDGAGCERTRRLHASRQHAEIHEPAEGEIFQPYLPGTAASVCLVVANGDATALPPARQDIVEQADGTMRYEGSQVPLSQAAAQRARGLAQQAVAAVPGLAGFVGVDVVLGERSERDAVIEINPRPTLSYLALRALAEAPLPLALWNPETTFNWPSGAARVTAGGEVQVSAAPDGKPHGSG